MSITSGTLIAIILTILVVLKQNQDVGAKILQKRQGPNGTNITDPNTPIQPNPNTPIQLNPNTPIQPNPNTPIQLNPNTPIQPNQNTPIQPNPNTPIQPNPNTPIQLNPNTPIQPNPNTPIQLNPNTPIQPNPNTPKQLNPNIPISSDPNTPKQLNPNIPISSDPNTPKQLNPNIPISSDPNTPKQLNPNTPIQPNPNTPIQPNPNTPIQPKPNTPIQPNPNTPIQPNPNTPKQVNPNIPISSDPNTPKQLNPNTPIQLNPNTPIQLNPNTPIQLNPNTPIQLNPNTPIQLNPNTPMSPDPNTPLTSTPTPSTKPSPFTTPSLPPVPPENGTTNHEMEVKKIIAKALDAAFTTHEDDPCNKELENHITKSIQHIKTKDWKAAATELELVELEYNKAIANNSKLRICDRALLHSCHPIKQTCGCNENEKELPMGQKLATGHRYIWKDNLRSLYCYAAAGPCKNDPATNIMNIFEEEHEKIYGHYGNPKRNEDLMMNGTSCVHNMCVLESDDFEACIQYPKYNESIKQFRRTSNNKNLAGKNLTENPMFLRGKSFSAGSMNEQGGSQNNNGNLQGGNSNIAYTSPTPIVPSNQNSNNNSNQQGGNSNFAYTLPSPLVPPNPNSNNNGNQQGGNSNFAYTPPSPIVPPNPNPNDVANNPKLYKEYIQNLLNKNTNGIQGGNSNNMGENRAGQMTKDIKIQEINPKLGIPNKVNQQSGNPISPGKNPDNTGAQGANGQNSEVNKPRGYPTNNMERTAGYSSNSDNLNEQESRMNDFIL